MSPGRKKLVPRRKRRHDVVEDESEGEAHEALEDDCVAIDEENSAMITGERREDMDDGNDDEYVNDGGGGDVVGEGNENDESDEDIGDDIWNDETIPDALSSDDEEKEARIETREDATSSDEILWLGKTFGSASEFKQALLRYSLKTGYDIKISLSTQKKIGAICSDTEDGCAWKVYCSYEKRKHKLQIKTYQSDHICIRSGYSKMLKSSSIAQLFEERLRANPKLRAKDILDDIKRNYNFNVTEEQCRKAKTKLTKQRRASHEAHFSRIWDYQAEIFKKNPGTTMDIETIPGPTPGSKQRFDRLYVCFEAQRNAWMSSCRPIIGLDGAFLKWDVKGQLLAAVGRDGDNRIVPIAWAVVEIENEINWDWFVSHLKVDLGLDDGSKITIISDKHKGLLNAVRNILPQAEHRMCARHVLGNWKRESHDMELERLFWKIARSYTKGDYEDNLQELRRYNHIAHESLMRTNPPGWSRAFFRVGSYCNDNLNNLNESFNRTIREARRKPLLDMLEEIRIQCMVRTSKRKLLASRLKTRFTKSAHAEIESAKDKSKDCIRYMATDNFHEIHFHGVSYSVDMNVKTCGCGKWQLIGIPCSHAACVITAKKLKFEDYVSEYYTSRMWRQTYEHSIRPLDGMPLWPRLNKLPVLPPPNRKGNPGRPSNYDRKKSQGEAASSSKKTKLSREKRIMTCSNCREEGHNRLSCSKPAVEAEAKRPKGRPRKYQEGQPQRSQGGSQIGSQIGSQEGSQA